jgi:LEA14-like dessication related protein
MSNKLVSNIAFIGGIGLLGYGVYAYIQRQKKLLKDFDYKILGGKILSAELSNVSLELRIKFINKSDVEMVVNSFDLDFSFNDVVVGKLTDTDSFVIAAKGDSEIPMKIDFDPTIVLSNILDIINLSTQGGDFFFGVKGSADIRSSFIKTKVPIEFVTSWNEIMSN